MNLITAVNALTILLWSGAFLLWGFEKMHTHLVTPSFIPSREKIHAMLWLLIVFGLLGSIVQTFAGSR